MDRDDREEQRGQAVADEPDDGREVTVPPPDGDKYRTGLDDDQYHRDDGRRSRRESDDDPRLVKREPGEGVRLVDVREE